MSKNKFSIQTLGCALLFGALFRNNHSEGNRFTAVPIIDLGKNGPPTNSDGTNQQWIGLAGSKDLDEHFIALSKRVGKIEPEKAAFLYDSFLPFLTDNGAKKVRSLLGVRKTKANGDLEELAVPADAQYDLILVKKQGDKSIEIGAVENVHQGTVNDVIRGINELLSSDTEVEPAAAVA
jgi:hypothetical protein